MSDGFGFGGNSFAASGQIAVTASAQAIPLPNANALVPGTALVHVTAPSGADIFVGPSGVTTATGHRIPQNTAQSFSVKQALYIIGTSGTATYLYEYN